MKYLALLYIEKRSLILLEYYAYFQKGERNVTCWFGLSILTAAVSGFRIISCLRWNVTF